MHATSATRRNSITATEMAINCRTGSRLWVLPSFLSGIATERKVMQNPLFFTVLPFVGSRLRQAANATRFNHTLDDVGRCVCQGITRWPMESRASCIAVFRVGLRIVFGQVRDWRDLRRWSDLGGSFEPFGELGDIDTIFRKNRKFPVRIRANNGGHFTHINRRHGNHRRQKSAQWKQ